MGATAEGVERMRTASPAEAERFVRLHVVAADDSGEAQALKLRVRDAVLAAARAMLEEVKDADEAWQVVNARRDELEVAARRRARAEGYSGTITCETGIFAFPDRQYGGVRVPAGDYRALRVVIGAGAGRNWWCVLYPSLCWPGNLEDARPYSAIWNWLKGLLGGEAP